MPYVRSYIRRTRRGLVSVRSHYRRRPRRRLNFFYARRGVFVAGGLSKKYGPYLVAGYKEGPVKLKTSVGLQGHKASASVKLTRNTEVGVEHNLTFNRTNVRLRHKNKKIEV